MQTVHYSWLGFCCLCHTFTFPFFYLLSWVFIKQVHSTAAGNFSLLLNGPTHNSSIFLLCQVAARHVRALSKRKGQNRCPWPSRSLQNALTFFSHLRCMFTPSSLLCFNAAVNDIRSLSWHIIRGREAALQVPLALPMCPEPLALQPGFMWHKQSSADKHMLLRASKRYVLQGVLMLNGTFSPCLLNDIKCNVRGSGEFRNVCVDISVFRQ